MEDVLLGMNSVKKVEAMSSLSHQHKHYKHSKRKTNHSTTINTTTSLLFTLLLLLIVITTTHTTTAQEIPETDNYCGLSWTDAARICLRPCASGSDDECIFPDTCQIFTGCYAKLTATYPPTLSPTGTPSASPSISVPPTGRPTTATPTSVPSVSPSSFPSGVPTASPVVNWYPDVDTTKLIGGLDDDTSTSSSSSFMTVEDDPSSRSYGCIFELVSTISSPAIAIRNIEFFISYDDELFISDTTYGISNINPTNGEVYSNATAIITYEVWIRPETWHGYEGRVRAFEQLTTGNITVMNDGTSHHNPEHKNDKLISVSINNFDPIKIDGGGLDRRALYVTLSTRNMLYQRSSEPDKGTESISSIEDVETQGIVTEDTIVLAQSDHLIVYEGAAVMTYPFKDAKEPIFYRMPRGFVGRIEYDREPCELVPVLDSEGVETGELISVQRWEECTKGTKMPRPTVRPTIWVKPSVTDEPTRVPTKKPIPVPVVPTTKPPIFVGVPTASPIQSPTASPSLSIKPSIFIMKSYLIMTFNNIQCNIRPPDSCVMDAREQNSFEKSIVSFLNRQAAVKANEVVIQGSSMWYQQTYTMEEWNAAQQPKGRKDGEDTTEDSSGGDDVNGRTLQADNFDIRDSEEAPYDSSGEEGGGQQGGTDLIIPSQEVASLLEVTVIISVESSPLPEKITSQLFETMIRDYKVDFLESLKDVGSLSDLFARTDDVPMVLALDRVTSAPTLSPTMVATEEVVIEEVPGMFSTTVGIILLIIAIIWIVLVFMGFSKIKRARRLMKIQRDRRIIGEDAFKAPYHGMVYDGEKKKKKGKDKPGRRSSFMGGMRSSFLGASDHGGKKSSFLSKDSQESFGLLAKSEEEYVEDSHDMSSMEDSYSEEESLSMDGSDVRSSSSGSY